MARTLVRAGRARGIVSACLAEGRRAEAESLSIVHYSYTAQAHTAGCRSVGGAVGQGGSTVGSSATALKRFAEEFGLDLPSKDGQE